MSLIKKGKSIIVRCPSCKKLRKIGRRGYLYSFRKHLGIYECRACSGGRKPHDLSGEKVNGIKVIKPTGYRFQPSGSRVYEWLCLCHCGKRFKVQGFNLSAKCNKAVKSCGCLHKKTIRLLSGETSEKASWNALFNKYKGDAKINNVPWFLSYNETMKLFRLKCNYCGVKPSSLFNVYISLSGNITGTVTKEWAKRGWIRYNGIDRVIPQKGYISENIVPCCKTCNYAKHTQTLGEFNAWIDRLVEHRRMDAKNYLHK